MKYILNYTVPVTKQFEVDITDLAELVFNDFISDGTLLDVDWMLNYFNDNIEVFLHNNLGFPRDVELEDWELDKIYDDIASDLEEALVKLIAEYEADNNRTNNN